MGDLFRFFCMNPAHRLLLVSTESAAQSPPHPSFAPWYLTRVLLAYAEHYGGNPSLSIVPLKAGVDLASLWQQVSNPEADWVLIQAEDSFASPLWADTTIADLAWDWRLATVLLVPLGTQTVSQTIAYTALARQSRCCLKGVLWVAHDQQAWDDRVELAPPHLLHPFIQVPLLGTLPPWDANRSTAALAQLASELRLEYFFPFVPSQALPKSA